jgi:hypothetical protein
VKPFQGFRSFYAPVPKVVAAAPNLGLKLANAFGVIFKLNQYPQITQINLSKTCAKVCNSFSASTRTHTFNLSSRYFVAL